MNPQSERNQHLAFRSTAAAALVLMIVAALFLGWTLHLSRQRHLEDATHNLQNVTFNLERNLYSTLQSADLVLKSAQQTFTRLNVQTGGERAAATEVVQALGHLLPEANYIRGADAEGNVMYGAGSDPSRPVNIRDRKYFQEARASKDIVIGLPLLSRGTKKWVLPVARALRDGNGEFAGVIYLLLPVGELQQNLSGLNLRRLGVATVFNHRSEVIARSFPLKTTVDEDTQFLVGPDLRLAVREGRAGQAIASVSAIDGVSRLSMYRSVGTYPLYVAAGLEYEELLAPWWHEVLVALISWLALLGLALCYVYSQWRSMRRHSRIVAELEESRRHSEEVARYKAQFLANMSHEIRTPLNGVLGFAQIGHKLPGGTPDHVQAFTRILDAGTHLNGVLNDILDMAKIDAGKLVLRPGPTVLEPLVERMVSLVRAQAEAKGVELLVNVSSSVPATLTLDALRLEQILLNLLSNAVKFTERGRVRLYVDATESTVAFTVKDSGVGMDQAHRARLFKAFEQADSSTTRRFGGTGLGLTITKRLVDMMGGQINVVSQLNVGSAFEVRLPLRLSEPAPPALSTEVAAVASTPAAKAAAGRLAGVRLLVADDNEVNQLVMKGMLKTEGADVTVVGDGEQAVQWLAKQAPHELPLAILMDVQMPVMDGFEASRLICAKYPGLPVIGQTAHALPEDRQRCLEAGMVEHVGKPLDMEKLVALLQSTARQRAALLEASSIEAL